MYGSATSLSDFYWFEESEKKKQFDNLYTIVGKLGEGFTATVFKCLEKGTHKLWALKKIRKSHDALSRSRRKEAALAEIGVLLKMRHPNVVRIAGKGVYREKDAALCVSQLLSGIKPENLLYEDMSENALLKIAPEILQRMEYSKAVDMWPIGVIIYVLLCGYEPFYDSMDANMYKKILKCDYEFHEKFWSEISSNAKLRYPSSNGKPEFVFVSSATDPSRYLLKVCKHYHRVGWHVASLVDILRRRRIVCSATIHLAMANQNVVVSSATDPPEIHSKYASVSSYVLGVKQIVIGFVLITLMIVVKSKYVTDNTAASTLPLFVYFAGCST
ncbi:Calcium/calmodulin-dependent protein kinase type IV, partial [Lamellibrachia satsuma]